MVKEAAETFVDFSDMANVTLCFEKTMKADIALEIMMDCSEMKRDKALRKAERSVSERRTEAYETRDHL